MALETTAEAAHMTNDLWAAIQPETIWQDRTGRGVRVAVVDSGIDTEHPDLKGKVKESVEAVAEDGRIDFHPPTSGDQAGHATASARIITSGGPNAHLYTVTVLGPTPPDPGAWVLAG